MEKENKKDVFFGIGRAIRSFSDGIRRNLELSSSMVIDSLERITIRKTQYTTEKNVENIICKYLKEDYENVHQQYNIGGYLGLKIDIDLDDGSVGIELKLAKELQSASAIERLLGQVLFYSRRVYEDKLIVCVVGTKKEYDQKIKEIETIIKEQGVNFIYIEV